MAYPRPKTMIEIKRTLTDVEEVKWELTDENINKNQVKWNFFNKDLFNVRKIACFYLKINIWKKPNNLMDQKNY